MKRQHPASASTSTSISTANTSTNITTNNTNNSNTETWITSSELNVIWTHQIGAALSAREIVTFSGVNKWANKIAHDIKTHKGFASVKGLANYNVAIRKWPHLRFELRLREWEQQYNNTTTHSTTSTSSSSSSSSSSTSATAATAATRGCVSLILWNCKISSFDFIDTRMLEQFVLFNLSFKAEPSVRQSLEKMLTSCHELQSLELSHCVCMEDHDGVEWLSNALDQLPQLTALDLHDNRLGDSRISKIANALRKMTKLTSLNLLRNRLEEDGTIKVCECLRQMTNITKLDLAGNNMGPGVAKILADSIAHMLNMTWLVLYGNGIDNEGMNILSQVLCHMSNLSYLDLTLNRLDHDTKAQIRRLLSHVDGLYL